jgi:hypothetical protein
MIDFVFRPNLALNLLMSKQLPFLVLEALRKKYEDRSYLDHKNLVGVIAPLFPTLSLKKIKMMTFYLQLKESNLEVINESIFTLILSYLIQLLHNHLYTINEPLTKLDQYDEIRKTSNKSSKWLVYCCSII